MRDSCAQSATDSLANAQEKRYPDYAYPLGGGWDIETLFPAYATVGEPLTMSDVPTNPGSGSAIETQRPDDALALAGLLVVENMPL